MSVGIPGLHKVIIKLLITNVFPTANDRMRWHCTAGYLSLTTEVSHSPASKRRGGENIMKKGS